jgi:hypothetical protein
MCDCQQEDRGGIANANGDTDVVLHNNNQLYPPLVIVPGKHMPQLLSEVLAESRIAQIEQGVLDWPIDPQLLNLAPPILEAAVPQGASVHPGPNAVAPLVLNADAPQGGPANLNIVVQPVDQLPNPSTQLGDPANVELPDGAQSVVNGPIHHGGPVTQGHQQASQSVLNTPLQNGGPAYLGLQPGTQSVFNPPIAQGGLPVLQLPFQQVQQQPAVQAHQLGAQRSADDRRRFPTAEARQAGALPAPPGGATPDMMYRPFPGQHGMMATKWYHGYQVKPNGVAHWKCAYCECSTSDPNAVRKI